MMYGAPSLEKLVRLLQQIPYLASKNLWRVVSHFLQQEPGRIEQLCAAIVDARKNVVRCVRCFFWQEAGLPCAYCSSPSRDQSVICVVEHWYDLMAIEKSGAYQGAYHVLGGVICPLDGIGPQDLTIASLVERVAHDRPKEILLAFNQTPEAEATAAFIARKIPSEGVTISRLARGVPVGAFLEAMDRVTLCKAISERRPF